MPSGDGHRVAARRGTRDAARAAIALTPYATAPSARFDAAAHAVALASQHRVHDDGRQEAERAEADRRQKRKRSLDADFGSS